MPEMLTKYPDSALLVLKSAGAKCGEGGKQKILVHCPKEYFCALPQGEICVYDIKNLKNMTQIHPTELAALISPVPTIHSPHNLILILVIFLLGLVIGFFLKRRP